MKTIDRILFFLILLLFSGSSCSPKLATTPGVTISSTAPVNPVLKGMATNPVLRIAVNISGSQEINYKGIRLSLNSEARNSIENMDVYFTDTLASFASKNKIASLSSLTKELLIPINIRLSAGVHYLWLSASLKSNANVDKVIEVHANALVDEKNNKQTVSEDESAFKKRTGIALRKAGDDNVNTYRIPGITTTDKGTLIAVYDIRYNNSKDLPENIDVGMSRSVDGGETWQPMKVIMDMGAPHENNGIGDPSILFDPVTKKIWVAALWSKGNRSIAGSEPGLSPDTTGQFVLVSSRDDGLSWSVPYNITTQVKDPAWHLYFQGPGSGIAMQNGTLVFPSQYWDESRKPGLPHSSIIYSSDHGNSWKSGIGAKSNTTESNVVETQPGSLMLNMRDNRGKFRSVAVTNDMGKTWKEHATSQGALPDPVCMGSLIKARMNVKGIMKDVLFFSNPNTSSGRYNITIKASLDLGETWESVNQLLVDERRCYGYSTLTKVDDNTIGILYEGTKDLYFVKVPVGEIIK
ncbi:MAG TPA: exo-alpha-sialidase [Chitinophagaceae bacterium]|nr:exo-alpha-sialidase [Chitinophagaceae bacterium]